MSAERMSVERIVWSCFLAEKSSNIFGHNSRVKSLVMPVGRKAWSCFLAKKFGDVSWVKSLVIFFG